MDTVAPGWIAGEWMQRTLGDSYGRRKVFVIGTVEMKSNVTLHIAAGGKLLGSADGKQYYAAESIPLRGDSTLGDGNVGLIFGVRADNVTIEGAGTIDGQGAQFRSPSRGVAPPSGLPPD